MTEKTYDTANIFFYITGLKKIITTTEKEKKKTVHYHNFKPIILHLQQTQNTR